jgi:hypothetical protein
VKKLLILVSLLTICTSCATKDEVKQSNKSIAFGNELKSPTIADLRTYRDDTLNDVLSSCYKEGLANPNSTKTSSNVVVLEGGQTIDPNLVPQNFRVACKTSLTKYAEATKMLNSKIEADKTKK